MKGANGAVAPLPPVDLEALLCALVLAPRSFARNRFFALFQDAQAQRVRRRAQRVRGVVRQLAERGHERATVTGEQLLDDGRVLVRYEVTTLKFQRTVALSALEAATVRYALHRAGGAPLGRSDRVLVEAALARLGPTFAGVSAAD